MLHCLALGSIVYYSLELLHHTLESEVVQAELEAKVQGLERQVVELQRGGGGAVSGSEGKTGGWRSWIGL